jgi:hypothetical protein
MTNNYNINKRYNQSIFSHAGNYLINQWLNEIGCIIFFLDI